MANICKYKVIVKGKRNACMAFYGSMACMEQYIHSDEGTSENCTIFFEGSCKWGVDAYCKSWNGKFPVDLPETEDEAYKLAQKNYWYYTVLDRSKMFNVEVLCNSADMDDYTGSHFEHYINGKRVYDAYPDELKVIPDYFIESPFCFDIEELYEEPFEEDRVKVYYNKEKRKYKYNKKFFIVQYENPVIKQILKKYKYTFEKIKGVYYDMDIFDPFNIDICIDINILNPNYAGVTTLNDFTLTLINLLIAVGAAEPGFEVELTKRKDEIMESFHNIVGISAETGKELENEIAEVYIADVGYYFEFREDENGHVNYIASYCKFGF